VASAATRALLDERGWKVTELAKWLDRRVPVVSLFVAGRFDHPSTR
jgi:plasmid maintenance system antidote protein VapI